MICPPCQAREHEKCEAPISCSCQHRMPNGGKRRWCCTMYSVTFSEHHLKCETRDGLQPATIEPSAPPAERQTHDFGFE